MTRTYGTNGAYDVVIAGGGPAGTSAAITSARLGARVLLLERGRFPRNKVCGEFVSPEALGLLESLLAGNPDGLRMLRDAPRIRQGRILAAGHCAEFPLPAPGASISRREFDAALWEAAIAAGAETRQGVTVQGLERNGTFRVVTSAGTYTAMSVIDASGRWSNLNHSRQHPARGAMWLGLKAHFFEEEPSPSSDLYFFPGGYCGVQPLGGGRVNVCAMVRSDRARSLGEVFALHPQLQERSRGWQPAGNTVVTAPLVFRPPRPSHSGILYAGDAAAFLDPFVGDGISAALHSGRLAARALSAFWHGSLALEQSVIEYQRGYERALLPAIRAARRLRRLIDLPAALHAPTMRLLRLRPVARYLASRTRAAVR